MVEAAMSKDGKSQIQFPVVFTAGFRFFFLFAGLYAVFAMVAWVFWLGVHAAGGAFLALPINTAPHLWHAHEMMFGYTVAVMAGFFVTAVPNWTGSNEAGPAFVMIAGLVWLSGRIAVGMSSVLDPLLVAAIDLAFVPVLSIAIFGRLAQLSQLRNVIFLFLLAALFIGNLFMHLEWLGWAGGNTEAGVRLGIFASAAMIAIIGGRVVPAFTRNALNRAGHTGKLPASHKWLDRVGILSALLAVLACLPFVPEQVLGLICLVAGGVNLARLFGWVGLKTLNNPILWVLHVAYLLLGAGYIVYGSSILFAVLPETAALHLLAVGAVGCMTMAMMTRASLGHSGRPLIAPAPISIAYVLIIAGALVRTFGTQFVEYYTVMFLSGGLWIAAFSLYLGVYFPILTTPRKQK
ncbi:NnrS family protein [Labrenzia sp. PHM005]|uniref:NnrS family protein n=1 Tax=Labrenzia sp. PHM005 TaxID=2590016 RepID=UPI0011403FED|nr:NnrS family protein [Labrenzia sp. PHM005]QDG79345.1 NnrS family protein [Labrenzia sp. PHM005]